MAQYGLTQEALDLITNDQELQGKIAKDLDVSVSWVLNKLVKENRPSLTQASVLQIIAVHTGENKTTKFLQPDFNFLKNVTN